MCAYEFRDGKIREVRTVYDRLSLLQQSATGCGDRRQSPVLAEYSHPFKDSSFKMDSPFGLFVLISGSLTGWYYSARTGWKR